MTTDEHNDGNRTVVSHNHGDISHMRGDRTQFCYPSHVVVDTRGGYVFRSDASGELFDLPRAEAFAELRNREMRPERRSYRVFALTRASWGDTAHAHHIWPARGCADCAAQSAATATA